MSETIEEKSVVLVVDDDRLLRRQLRWALADRYHLIEAEVAAEAIEKLQQLRINAVICDLHMPPDLDGINGGLSVIDVARKMIPPVPVVVITGSDAKQAALESVKHGAYGFFQKPFDEEEVSHVVTQAVLIHTLSSMLREDLTKSVSPSDPEAPIEEDSVTRDKVSDERIEIYEAVCASFAHSIKGELLHISFAAKELKRLIGDTSENQEELGTIERSVLQTQLLVQRLLNYFSFSEPQLEPVNLVELIDKVEHLRGPLLSSNTELKISLHNVQDELEVSANFFLLMSVLIELIDNANKVLSGRAGVIRVDVKGTRDKVNITVKDNGPGIPAEIKKKLFKEKIPSKSGSGLGLFLAGKVIKALGAELKLSTSDGKGTTFTITLPTVNK